MGQGTRGNPNSLSEKTLVEQSKFPKNLRIFLFLRGIFYLKFFHKEVEYTLREPNNYWVTINYPSVVYDDLSELCKTAKFLVVGSLIWFHGDQTASGRGIDRVLVQYREFIMPSKKSKTSKTDELVPVLFADSTEEAAEYCQLLEDHGVKATTDSGNNNPIADSKVDEDDKTDADDVSHGIPVFVYKSDVEEANEVISERDDLAAFALDEDELDEDDEEDFGMGPDTGDDDLFGLEDGLDEIL